MTSRHREDAQYTRKWSIKAEILNTLEHLIVHLPSTLYGNALRNYFYKRIRRKKLGKNVNLFSGVFLKGKVEIGDNVNIGCQTVIASTSPGVIVIGNNCLIAPHCYFRNANHEFLPGDTPIKKQGKIIEDILIGDNCWLAERVTILPGVKLDSGCVVGAGAVVTKSFGSGMVLGGIPAKILKTRDKGMETTNS
jgi:acetyltransferase-like isoleucine patch superfamily enzyme